jgi:nucleotide-binding universal stress UspA family protein
MGRVLLGSGAEQVIRLAPVPVLVVRLPEPPAAA